MTAMAFLAIAEIICAAWLALKLVSKRRHVPITVQPPPKTDRQDMQ